MVGAKCGEQEMKNYPSRKMNFNNNNDCHLKKKRPFVIQQVLKKNYHINVWENRKWRDGKSNGKTTEKSGQIKITFSQLILI